MANKTKRAGGLIASRKLNALLERWQIYETKLSLQQRKRQWWLVMGLLALVFMVSFIWSPWRGLGVLDSDGLKWSQPAAIQPSAGRNFEMPVDSFEWYLKNDLHERLSEKE